MSMEEMFNCPIVRWSELQATERQRILERSQRDMNSLLPQVQRWIDAVTLRGDEAVLEYIREFDDPAFDYARIRVTDREIEDAYRVIDPELRAAITEQIAISRRFHQELRRNLVMEWQAELIPGVVTGIRREAIESAGLYVPAGKAPLPTVAQILTVAAEAAGVPRIVVTFPPTGPHPAIIVAAVEAGAHEIYRVGGVAAIAALALGTATIKAVSKIAGPGSPYVQLAKLLLADRVGVDMFSGPSEAVIMADSSAEPRFLAADMLARCEHGPDSAAVVVTTSEQLAQDVVTELRRQAPQLRRQDYIQRALANYSAIVVVETVDEMVTFVNDYSPEHLEILMEDARAVFARIKNAGSTFLGSYAPVAVGDYASGTNHCLPTGRCVKYASAVGPETFLKTLQFQELTASGLRRLSPIVQKIAGVEGLDAHARSVTIREERVRRSQLSGAAIHCTSDGDRVP